MEASKSFEERWRDYNVNTLTEQDINKAATLVRVASVLIDENGRFKPSLINLDHDNLNPDVEMTKQLLEALEKTDPDTRKLEMTLTPDENGYYKVPVKIEMPSFIKGNKEAEERWNEIFSTENLAFPISIKPQPSSNEQIDAFNESIRKSMVRLNLTDDDMLFRPPFIDYDSVQQVYPNIVPMSFEEHESPFLGRGLTKSICMFDDVAFLDYNCWFIRERINLIKTRRTKHGKRKLIPYKASKILFKNVKPISTGEHVGSVDVDDPLNIEINFSYSN